MKVKIIVFKLTALKIDDDLHLALQSKHRNVKFLCNTVAFKKSGYTSKKYNVS